MSSQSFAMDSELKRAMRFLAGGVSVVTAGDGDDRTGMTITSAVSLSLMPATMMVCVNLSASSWPVIRSHRHFCVNVLGDHQEAIANRFAGRDGIKGAERYSGADWGTLESGAPALVDALANIDCELEEAIIRHTHAIVLGRVCAVRLHDRNGALAYWRGRYEKLTG